MAEGQKRWLGGHILWTQLPVKGHAGDDCGNEVGKSFLDISLVSLIINPLILQLPETYMCRWIVEHCNVQSLVLLGLMYITIKIHYQQ